MPQFSDTLVHITLPESKKHVGITVHSFLDGLYSLLTDPEVMKDENLLFHNQDPFCPPPDDITYPTYLYKDHNDVPVL